MNQSKLSQLIEESKFEILSFNKEIISGIEYYSVEFEKHGDPNEYSLLILSEKITDFIEEHGMNTIELNDDTDTLDAGCCLDDNPPEFLYHFINNYLKKYEQAAMCC